MLNSYSSGAFQISCLRFLNTFVETATNFRERVYIQAELEDAGFDISHLKKLVSKVRFYCATLNGLCSRQSSCYKLYLVSEFFHLSIYSLGTKVTF